MFNLNFNCHYHLFTIKLPFSCQLPNTLPLLKQTINTFHSSIQLVLTLFKLLRLPITIRFNTFNTS